ncbi:hypothetical protein COCOBI_07-0320 [Coccomyxa sp. Obi]|nr:hypothetical protein COCOBI_07-0320 [Coccomyxa sp. Obi]
MSFNFCPLHYAMGSRAAFFDRFMSRVECLEASEKTRLLQEVKRGRVVAFGEHCYVVRLRPTLVDLVGESFKDLSLFTAILFKGWPLDSAELPLAAKRGGKQRGKKRRAVGPPETPISGLHGFEWPASREANTTEAVSDRAKHHIQQASAAAIQEMQRWFCGQIQRLAKERDSYKALANERHRQLQAWEKALQFMPTRTPDLLRGRRLSVGV